DFDLARVEPGCRSRSKLDLTPFMQMSPRHLVLAVPGLLPPTDSGATVSRPRPDPGRVSLPAPSLARLIAGAGAPAPQPEVIGGALARAYGVARQADWPLAPIRVAAHGIDPGGAYWLAADPVTLEAGRDDVRLTGP